MSGSQYPPVMGLGCGRSGTSILGELFAAVKGYDYRSEPSYHEVVRTDFRTGAKAFKVPHASADYPPDPGLSFPMRDLISRAPNVKLVWIVRHPLDAICSLRVGINQQWGHHPRPPDWMSWLNRPLEERCAHHWQHINSIGYAQVREAALLVRFEEMIADPIAFALRLCDWTEIEVSPSIGQLNRWADRVQNTNNQKFDEAETSRPYSRDDHSVRVGRWRENLTPPEIERVAPIIGPAAREFGYTIETDFE